MSSKLSTAATGLSHCYFHAVAVDEEAVNSAAHSDPASSAEL